MIDMYVPAIEDMATVMPMVFLVLAVAVLFLYFRALSSSSALKLALLRRWGFPILLWQYIICPMAASQALRAGFWAFFYKEALVGFYLATCRV